MRKIGKIIVIVVALCISGFIGLCEAQTNNEVAPQQEVAPSAPLEISGVYLCSGHGLFGIAYAGLVEIQKFGEVFRLKWLIDGKVQNGVGILNGDQLVVSFPTDTTIGVLLYQIVSKPQFPPRMIGQWAVVGGDGKIYSENLIKIEKHPVIEEIPVEPPEPKKQERPPAEVVAPGERIL